MSQYSWNEGNEEYVSGGTASKGGQGWRGRKIITDFASTLEISNFILKALVDWNLSAEDESDFHNEKDESFLCCLFGQRTREKEEGRIR